MTREACRRATSLPVLLLTLAGGVALPVAARAQSFEGLDPLPFLPPESSASAISADGRIVAGYSYDGTDYRAVRWDENGTIELLDVLWAGESGANALSADGSIAAGFSFNGTRWQAVRWDANGDVEALDTFGLGRSQANALSADGSIAIGYDAAPGGYRAIRWDANGDAEVLNILGAGGNYEAWGVNAAGTVVVGFYNEFGNYRALRWDENGDPHQLDGLSFGNHFAFAVSDDGQFVAGYGDNGSEQQAIRWNGAGEALPIDPLIAGGNSYAWDISADGSIVIGDSDSADGQGAFLWTEADGTRSLASILQANGVDLGGWLLKEAFAITPDGTTIVGDGENPGGDPQGFIARMNGLTTAEGATQSVASVGQAGQGAHDFMNGLLGTTQEYALQHAVNAYEPDYQPLGYAPDLGANFPNIKKRTPEALRWRVFGYAEGHVMSDPEGGHGLGQLGASYAFADHGVVGGTLGFGGSTAEMAFDGQADFLGLSGSVFAAYVPPTGFQAIVSATAAGVDADIERGYMNGAGLASSEGETEGIGYGAALRVGYAFAVTPETALTPFGSFQVTRVDLDGYTETTGPFPAVVSDIEDTAEIARLGLEGRHALSSQTRLWASAVWAHRMDDEGAAVDAQLIGLFGISGATLTLDQDWAEVAGGVSYGFDDGLSRLTLSATAYLPGDDVSATGRVGYSRAF